MKNNKQKNQGEELSKKPTNKEQTQTKENKENTKEQDENIINDTNNTNSNECEELQKEIERLKEELKEKDNEYLRSYAELENTKKRFEREKYQAIDYASEKFATDLLSVMDTLQMALTHTDTNKDTNYEQMLQNLKEGINLTLKNFTTVFEKHDISEVEYDSFNPDIHQAIAQEDSDEHEDGAIIEVMQKGYVLKDRLLRPAMVKVCKK